MVSGGKCEMLESEIHLALKGLVVDVDGIDDLGRTTRARFADSCQNRADHLFRAGLAGRPKRERRQRLIA
jgi:hypothetical protein